MIDLDEYTDSEVQQLLANIASRYNLIVKCYEVEGWLDVSIIRIDGKIQIDAKDTSRTKQTADHKEYEECERTSLAEKV